jgi:hypothetical protein
VNVFDFDATTTQGGILLALWYLVLFAAVIGAIYAFCIFVGPSLDRITNRDNARRAAVPRG